MIIACTQTFKKMLRAWLPNSNLAIGQIYGPAWSHWLHRQVEKCNTELLLERRHLLQQGHSVSSYCYYIRLDNMVTIIITITNITATAKMCGEDNILCTYSHKAQYI